MPKNDDRARRRAEAQAEQLREAAARLVAERMAQGLPPTVTDPVVLARIAAILRSTVSALSEGREPDRQQQ
jgi:hypothetical protein